MHNNAQDPKKREHLSIIILLKDASSSKNYLPETKTN